MKKKYWVVFFLLSIWSTTFFALQVPDWTGPVQDLAATLSVAQKTELASYLQAVNDSTGVQVAVLTIPSLNGESIEDFTLKVADKWKLGQKDTDNGVLLFVALQDKEVRIEVGYGLEGELTDAKCGLIIRNVIIPHFKEGNFGKGIVEGVQNIVGIATGNAEIIRKSVSEPKSEDDGGLIGFAVLVLFIIIMLGNFGRRRRGSLFNSLMAAHIISSATKNKSSWSSHSGRSSGGGFSGGGFSGGGGHFGGGGASGKW